MSLCSLPSVLLSHVARTRVSCSMGWTLVCLLVRSWTPRGRGYWSRHDTYIGTLYHAGFLFLATAWHDTAHGARCACTVRQASIYSTRYAYIHFLGILPPRCSCVSDPFIQSHVYIQYSNASTPLTAPLDAMGGCYGALNGERAKRDRGREWARLVATRTIWVRALEVRGCHGGRAGMAPSTPRGCA
ncbi:hypothetical protein BD414DRAFT_224470 [Trametes punicea]|nr:hypothetical protein BD414DRAFT_224470 [Trametes punicea]